MPKIFNMGRRLGAWRCDVRRFRHFIFFGVIVTLCAWCMPGSGPAPPQSHLDRVLKGCDEICSYTVKGVPSKFFDYIQKNVDCEGLLQNAAIDEAMNETEPPTDIPLNMLADFTYGGKIPVKYWLPNKGVFNQRYLSKNALTPTWSKAMIDEWSAQCARRSLPGTYGVEATNQLLDGLSHIHLENRSVLVIGSEKPWVEACVLSKGAKSVTTLEYGEIQSLHPQVSTFTPDMLRADAKRYINHFDAVVTYSSVEHSGLGRYGDAMNPWGDRQAVARAWCMTKQGGRMAIGVPAVDQVDIIYYNAHRNYGPIQLPHLLANWKQIWQSPGGVQGMWVCEK